MTKKTRRWLSLGITAAVLAWIIYHVAGSSEGRSFDWNRLWSSLKHARTGYLLVATVATLSSYVVRAVRWRFFMDPIKKASLWPLFVGQILGFSSIYLIGRPGEFVRPAYIAKKEDVAISSMLAVWLLERLYDTGFLVVLFVLAVYFAPMHHPVASAQGMLAGPQHPHRFVPQLAHTVIWLLQRPHLLAGAILIALAFAVAVLVLIRLRAEQLAALLASIFRFLPARVRHWLRGVFYSFVEGLDAIRNWKDLTAGLISTAIVWVVNTSMVWFVFQSLGQELSRLSWIAAGLVLFWAALGLAFQLPGVGGGYQVGVFVALQRLFAVPREAAASAAILLWIVILVPCVTLGIVLLVYEGLSFRKLGAIAQEERAAMEQEKA